MPWPLQFQSAPPAPADRRAGMYWFGKNEIAPSPNFIADWRGKRPMIVIVCPDGTLWVPDQCPTYGSNTDTGWKVTGELPRISAHPSIGKPGYHGWLRDGVLSDDLEGRTYEPATEEEWRGELTEDEWRTAAAEDKAARGTVASRAPDIRGLDEQDVPQEPQGEK